MQQRQFGFAQGKEWSNFIYKDSQGMHTLQQLTLTLHVPLPGLEVLYNMNVYGMHNNQ